jgi:hypothetical protein
VRLAARRPRSLATGHRQPGPARTLPGSPALVLFASLQTQSADFLCQTLKAHRAWFPPSCPFRNPRALEYSWSGALHRTLSGGSREGALLFLKSKVFGIHFGPTSKGEIERPPGRAPISGKATIQPGLRLVSRRAPFMTDSPTAIHPTGMAAHTLGLGIFFQGCTPLDPLCSA